MHYADSMILTIDGQNMYNYFMANPITEDTSSTAIGSYAMMATENYYINEYYTLFGTNNIDTVSMCHNSDFSLNTVLDTILIKWLFHV